MCIRDRYHLDPIEHDPWQLTSFLTTLYDDYTRSEVQGKLKETFKKQYKLTTWVEVQTRYMTVWVMTPAGVPIPTQVPYEYRIFHTKLVNRGLEVVIREELNLSLIHILSAKGLEQLLQTVQKVRRQINPKLKIEGIPVSYTHLDVYKRQP